MADDQDTSFPFHLACCIEYGLWRSAGRDSGFGGEVFCERLGGLLGAPCRAYQDARIVRQAGAQENSHFFSLLLPFCSKPPLHVGYAILGFGVTPQYQIHVFPLLQLFPVVRIYRVAYFRYI